MNQDRLTLRLAFNGRLPLLRDYVALEKRLELMGGPPDGAIPANPVPERLALYYRWNSDDAAPRRARGDVEPVEIVPLKSSGDESAGDVAPLR